MFLFKNKSAFNSLISSHILAQFPILYSLPFPFYIPFPSHPPQHSVGTTTGLREGSPGLILGLGHTEEPFTTSKSDENNLPILASLHPSQLPLVLGCCKAHADSIGKKTTRPRQTMIPQDHHKDQQFRPRLLGMGCNGTISEGATTEKCGPIQKMGSRPKMCTGRC